MSERFAVSAEDAWRELVEAAHVVNDERATWEPTERNRARLHNALLDLEAWEEISPYLTAPVASNRDKAEE